MLRVRDFIPADAPWVLAEHIEHYTEVEQFDATFGTAVEAVLSRMQTAQQQDAARGWIAEVDGERAGCIFLTRDPDSTANVRLFYTTKGLRRTGVGQTLLDSFEASGAGEGSTVLRVTTFAEHAAACRVYARNGYSLVDSFATQAFGRALTEQRWEKAIEGM